MSDCPHCARYAEENAKLTAELSGMLVITRNAAGTITGLKGQRTRQLKEEATAQDVMAILKVWRALLAPKASIKLEGARADIVRKALGTLTNGERKECRRMCMDAVRGLALRQYTGPHGRTANSVGTVRRHEIRYALMDEEHIEEHAGFYRAVEAKPLDWLDRAWGAAIASEAHWRWLYFQAWKRDCRERERAEVEAAIPDRPHLFVVPDPEREQAA